jgi:hypothetical protein
MNQKRKHIKTSTPTKSKQFAQNGGQGGNIGGVNGENNGQHFYTNMMKDFEDLDNFCAIPENAEAGDPQDPGFANYMNVVRFFFMGG